ncbi:MAG: carboxypeptidase-like regulatory domain-containing protein, partial [Bacteroidales bacterium]
MKRNTKILSIFLFLALSLSIKAQQSELVNFDVIASKIESVHHVKLYYKSEWFVNQLFKESIVDLPLEECLAVIERNAKLHFIKLRSDSYVFVPVEVRNFSYNTNRDGVLLIGEMSNPGENTKATISGKISDVFTGMPLKGATISIDELKASSTTDKDGNYKFTVPVGKYELALNYAGYGEDIRKINVFGNGIVDFEMSKKTIRLKEVV